MKLFPDLFNSRANNIVCCNRQDISIFLRNVLFFACNHYHDCRIKNMQPKNIFSNCFISVAYHMCCNLRVRQCKAHWSYCQALLEITPQSVRLFHAKPNWSTLKDMQLFQAFFSHSKVNAAPLFFNTWLRQNKCQCKSIIKIHF